MGMRSWWPSLRSDGSHRTCLLEGDGVTCAGSCGVLTWWGHTQGPRSGPYGGDHEVTNRTASRLEGPCGQGGHCLGTPEAKPSPGNTQG